ncbi:MAG: FKBP-type peptidyl-prolyl cis-trans isomerase [Thermoplasmata archaeon]
MSEEVEQSVLDGDLVYVDYDLWIVHPDGKEDLFDTTDKDLAEEHEKFDEKRNYVPEPLVVGKGRIFPGWEESLRNAKVGVKTTVEIPPEKAAGERDPRLVELHSIREFVRREIAPEVGKEVILGKKKGIITSVTAGRVRVDFNNPLAGRTLKYDYTVTKKAETVEDKVKGIIEMDYTNPEDFEVKVIGQDVLIKLPEVCKYDELWLVSKYRVANDLRDIAGIDTIRFIEEYVKKEKPEEEEPTEEAELSERKEEAEVGDEKEEEEFVPEELPPEEISDTERKEE